MAIQAIEGLIQDSLQVVLQIWHVISADPRIYNAFLLIGILWIASEIKKKTFFVLASVFSVYYALNWFGIDAQSIGTAIYALFVQVLHG